jgi:mannose-6-phosphate isomerase-like protein (cupin superfamily)
MKIRIADHVRLSPAKMAKIGLATTARAQLDLYCVGPGQAQAVHAHADQDKIYYVVEGSGRFTIGDRQERLEAGEAVVAPSGVPHGLENEGDQPLLVLVVITPPPPHAGGLVREQGGGR